MKFKKLIVLMMPLTSISIEGGYRNCTKNDSAVIYAGQKRRIRQYVYEWGYPYAFIGLAPSSGQSGLTISGKWSPDSVGSDPYANNL